jgi:hypothetical protein
VSDSDYQSWRASRAGEFVHALRTSITASQRDGSFQRLLHNKRRLKAPPISLTIVRVPTSPGDSGSSGFEPLCSIVCTSFSLASTNFYGVGRWVRKLQHDATVCVFSRSDSSEQTDAVLTQIYMHACMHALENDCNTKYKSYTKHTSFT